MDKILIANRGEIACRIMKTCREMGITTVAVASTADRHAMHAQMADEVVFLDGDLAATTYLDIEKMIAAAQDRGAKGVHPGFGFLSENAAFAQAVRQAGLIFIGPDHHVIAAMGSKQGAKEMMANAGVPVVPGYNGANQDPKFLAAKADEIGYPLLIKASAGGGGKGMRLVASKAEFSEALATAKREATAAFGDDTMLLEKYLPHVRHVEFQILGDHHGNLVHLFERECSIQRRHQKVLEESPSPGLHETVRGKMAAAALTAGRAAGYANAGTVEFMLDDTGQFYFLEMNTRLQVEHPVTEMITGLDLVRLQIQVARGEELPFVQEDITRRGHAIEVRVYAEDPAHGFLPQTGKILRYNEPQGISVRVDGGFRGGDTISIHYDPMLAKLITWGATREIARQKMEAALQEYCIHGVVTNLTFLSQLVAHPKFVAGETFTDFLGLHFQKSPPPQEVVETAIMLTMMAGPSDAAGGATTGEAVRPAGPWQSLPSWRLGS